MYERKVYKSSKKGDADNIILNNYLFLNFNQEIYLISPCIGPLSLENSTK